MAASRAIGSVSRGRIRVRPPSLFLRLAVVSDEHLRELTGGLGGLFGSFLGSSLSGMAIDMVPDGVSETRV